MTPNMATARKRKTPERPGQHLIWISAEARQLLNTEAERIKRETGGKPSGSFLADRIIKERLGQQ